MGNEIPSRLTFVWATTELNWAISWRPSRYGYSTGCYERKFRLTIRPHSAGPNLGDKDPWLSLKHARPVKTSTVLALSFVASFRRMNKGRWFHAAQGISSCAKALHANELGWHSCHAQVLLSPHTEKATNSISQHIRRIAALRVCKHRPRIASSDNLGNPMFRQGSA